MKPSLESTPFILASTSPRRISLLEMVQISAQVYAPFSDEKAKRGEEPRALVKRLAEEKAISIIEEMKRVHSRCFILAADTIVVEPTGKRVLGKPKDKKQARQMLQQLSGKTHTVLTGYCLIRISEKNGKSLIEKKIRGVQSKVRIRKLTGPMIDHYITTGEPMDKAGSYGAQGLGMALIESIQGSYTNVVGLPIAQVLQDLEDHFQIPLFSWFK